MPPDQIFALANPLAMLGWLVLAFSPLAPRWADRIAGYAIPALLAALYAALIMAFWASAPGGFGSLAQVMALFTNPGAALAGWTHYLAFDLFIGAWQVRRARAIGLPHLAVLPCLVLTFLFGPIGLLLFLTLATTRRIGVPA